MNYYPAGASMGGHLDDAEINMEQPIVSHLFLRVLVYLYGDVFVIATGTV